MKISSQSLPRSIVVGSYADLTPWLNGFVRGMFHLLFLIGRPGLGKTQAVLRTLQERPHVLIDCHATKLAIYCKLYVHRDQPVVIDDDIRVAVVT